MFHPQLMPGLLESWKSIRSAVDYRCLPYLDVRLCPDQPGLAWCLFRSLKLTALAWLI